MSDAELKMPGRWTRRPLFAPSQLLTAEQLTTLMESQRTHSERLMRALHGHGVIFGLAVSGPSEKDLSPDCEPQLRISCGMALDMHGRLLRWPGGPLTYGEIVNRTDCAGTFLLKAHYAERKEPKGGCGPCAEQPDWIEDGVVFSLAPVKGDKCPPDDRACPVHKDCVDLDHFICFRTGSQKDKRIDPADDLETACRDPAALKPVECSDLWLDPGAGIAIACVRIGNVAPEGCEAKLGFLKADQACAVRPRVFRTPLLYELIRGCQNDLPRVKKLSWQDFCVDGIERTWNYQIDWATLETLLRKPRKLVITFSKPIRVTTVHPGSVFLSTRYKDPGEKYLLVRRIPVYVNPPHKGMFSSEFILDVDDEWLKAEFDSTATLRAGGTIELTIRGQMLRDECGNMLDAVPLFYTPKTPILNRPGGDFVAVFKFGKAPDKPKQQKTPRPKSPRESDEHI